MNLLETEAELRGIAQALDEHFIEKAGRRLGFCLILFEFGGPGTTNYVSNADRADMIKGLKETIEQFEKNQIIPAVTTGEQ